MLIQLVGPPGCGKTELRNRLCSNLIHIGNALRSPFNAEMLFASGFWFEEMALDRRMKRRLQVWMASEDIPIDIMCKPSTTRKNPGVWIYEGEKPIAIKPTMIWNVNRL